MFFLEMRGFGECFILLTLQCRNILDMVHGTALISIPVDFDSLCFHMILYSAYGFLVHMRKHRQ
jgi:hypothetical protein